jgi:hypothetical protein
MQPIQSRRRNLSNRLVFPSLFATGFMFLQFVTNDDSIDMRLMQWLD